MEHTQNGKAFFVKAEIRESQAGNLYVWTKSFDLAGVVRELGTSVVTITMVRPKNAKSEAERLVIFKAGDARFSGKGNGGRADAIKNEEAKSEIDCQLENLI